MRIVSDESCERVVRKSVMIWCWPAHWHWPEAAQCWRMGSDGESRDGIRDQPGSQLTQPVTCDLIMQPPPSLIHFYEICFFLQRFKSGSGLWFILDHIYLKTDLSGLFVVNWQLKSLTLNALTLSLNIEMSPNNAETWFRIFKEEPYISGRYRWCELYWKSTFLIVSQIWRQFVASTIPEFQFELLCLFLYWNGERAIKWVSCHLFLYLVENPNSTSVPIYSVDT